ncbi:LysR family transcriptional regulator [Streptomyces sp. NPDC004096]
MDTLETRELTYFVTVAEELHFGRAAERLGIAQPPLSRAIARLERRMGVRLFDRTSRRVALTSAGSAFLDGSRQALAAVDTAVRMAQSAGQPTRLTLATRPGTGSGLLADALRAYSRQPSAVDTHIVFTQDQAAAVRNGTADVALMCGSGDTEGLHFVELASERPLALLPTGHPMAGRVAVTLAELAKDNAFQPQCPADSLDEIVDRVALGSLVAIVGEGVTDRLGRSVTAVPVLDMPNTELVLSWSRHAPHPHVAEFVRSASAIASRSASQQLQVS